jgi:hypothetical protein
VLPQAYRDLVGGGRGCRAAAAGGADRRGGGAEHGHWRYHLACEHQRLYPGIKQGQHALAA